MSLSLSLSFAVTFVQIKPLTFLPSSLSHWLKLLHYPKLVCSL